LIVDPSLILRAQGIQPDPWQRRLLLSNHPRVLLNCSRGAGKSRICSVLALHTALVRRNSLVLLVSRSLRQACELLRYVKQGFHAIKSPIPARRDNEILLELDNGSRIVGLPGREETIRGFQGVSLLLLDEAARVPDQLYFSVRPMLNVARGRLVCLSTPFGARGFFWKEWHDTQANWERVCVPWSECPRIDAKDIEQERRAMGDAWVEQEYNCSFVTLHGLVYPDFGSATVESVPHLDGRHVGGIDFGWRNPFAAIWGILAGDVLWIVGERYKSEVPLHLHTAALKQLGSTMWFADPAGRTEIEEMRAAGLKVMRGKNDIRAGIAAVTARLRTGRLRVLRSACPHLIAEAGLYRYPTGLEVGANGENPIDENNHALAALRYLISRIDGGAMARLREGKSAVIAAPVRVSVMDDPALWTSIV